MLNPVTSAPAIGLPSRVNEQHQKSMPPASSQHPIRLQAARGAINVLIPNAQQKPQHQQPADHSTADEAEYVLKSVVQEYLPQHSESPKQIGTLLHPTRAAGIPTTTQQEQQMTPAAGDSAASASAGPASAAQASNAGDSAGQASAAQTSANLNSAAQVSAPQASATQASADVSTTAAASGTEATDTADCLGQAGQPQSAVFAERPEDCSGPSATRLANQSEAQQSIKVKLKVSKSPFLALPTAVSLPPGMAEDRQPNIPTASGNQAPALLASSQHLVAPATGQLDRPSAQKKSQTGPADSSFAFQSATDKVTTHPKMDDVPMAAPVSQQAQGSVQTEAAAASAPAGPSSPSSGDPKSRQRQQLLVDSVHRRQQACREALHTARHDVVRWLSFQGVVMECLLSLFDTDAEKRHIHCCAHGLSIATDMV